MIRAGSCYYWVVSTRAEVADATVSQPQERLAATTMAVVPRRAVNRSGWTCSQSRRRRREVSKQDVQYFRWLVGWHWSSPY